MTPAHPQPAPCILAKSHFPYTAIIVAIYHIVQKKIEILVKSCVNQLDELKKMC